MTQSPLPDLIHELQQHIGGEVRFDDTTRHLYSTDASNYQIMPLGVVIPRDADDVIAAHQIAAQYAAPILPRGGGSSLAGQTVGAAVVLDFSKHLRRVVGINAEARTVRVQAGMVLADLNKQLAPLGLMVGPDPASASRATIGGMIGNNSTGAHSILYGMTSDHVRALEVVMSDGARVNLSKDADLVERADRVGEAYRAVQRLLTEHRDEIAARYPKTWRTCAGYALNRLDPARPDLANLLVGSEGTLATTLEAELNLVPRPTLTRLVILHFDSLRASLEATPIILETEPSSVELVDKLLLDRTRATPEFARRLTFIEGNPAAVLVVEYYGESDDELHKKAERLKAHMNARHIPTWIVDAASASMQADVWAVRKAGLNLLMGIKGDHKPNHFIEDAAVTVDKLPDYVERVADIVHNAGTTFAIYAHASAGCLHIKPLINMKSVEGLRQYRQIGEAVADLVVTFGGTTSGEHGEGLARGCFSEKVFGATLVGAFRELKAAFDPDNRMNPGKMVDVAQMDDPRILRYNPDYTVQLAPAAPHFAYTADGSFAQAVEQCNGSGECRKTGSGVMCPSYMATLDEKDTTRGRANMLRLAMSGQLGAAGLSHEGVHDALDLCLSCKACKSECPSSVDLAKLKAEATDAYHQTHGTPLRSRLFANIAALNTLGAVWPALSNAVLTAPPSRAIFERIGVAPQRGLPLFAPQSFRKWFDKHPSPETAPNGEVILFDDTFLNFNDPIIGRAAVGVLHAAGYRVRLVDKRCCGRPAISKGLLDTATSMARHNIAILAPYARRGVPIIGIEPSCVSALIDDYRDLLPGDDAEMVAANTYTIDQFLIRQADAGKLELPFDGRPRRILFHGHCHHKALIGSETIRRMLNLIPNATVSEIPSGCCGVAGSFGYEAEHYDVSLKIGEDRLLPAVRAAGMDTIIAANGTSCREQITHGTTRAPLHPIQVVFDALQPRRPSQESRSSG
jgi:FAD/FMN-containing dehydrogenase/Fe-S oxidoreductase